VRWLGNKRHLLGEIEAAARSLGFERGTLCDLFAGTARVGRHFRASGSRVLATDTMASSHVAQKVFLELAGPPRFAGLAERIDLPPPADEERVLGAAPADPARWEPARRAFAWLESLPPAEGILVRQYSPEGRAGRRYLTGENAARFDAMLLALRALHEEGALADEEIHLLLATLIDAVDRVANISGTYGAYLKKWQSNALAAPELRLPAVVEGPVGAANRRDAIEWIGGVSADLLYIDPPYNNRQYAANFHLLEVVARIPFEPDLPAFEGSLYGKTGLIPWRESASPFCSRRGTECRDAFAALLAATSIPRVVISYNEEGIIAREEFEDLLAEWAGLPRGRLDGALREIPYRRFRSDADGRVSSTGSERSYRELPGRARNEVHEWLFALERGDPRGRPAAAGASRSRSRAESDTPAKEEA
jgi:adenine-specific DNA-methyltransferase